MIVQTSSMRSKLPMKPSLLISERNLSHGLISVFPIPSPPKVSQFPSLSLMTTSGPQSSMVSELERMTALHSASRWTSKLQHITMESTLSLIQLPPESTCPSFGSNLSSSNSMAPLESVTRLSRVSHMPIVMPAILIYTSWSMAIGSRFQARTTLLLWMMS